MQISSINNGTYTDYCQSKMSLLVIDFTSWKGNTVNWWSKTWQLSTLITTGSLRMCLKVPTVGKICQCFNVRLNEAIDHGCNWNDGFVPYSDLENVVHSEAYSTVAIYCLGALKTEFISSLINRTVIDITQLGCPPIADKICLKSAAHSHVITS